MTWEELKEKAKWLGLTISSYINEDEVELEYIYRNDYIYFEENGNIKAVLGNIVAENRTYEQMYQIMLALQ